MNHLYVTGDFSDASLIFYDTNSSIVLNNDSIDTYKTFIAKYDLNGVPIWANMIVGNLNNLGTRICTDNNYVYITGQFSDTTITLYHSNEPSSIVLNNYGVQNTFIAKYDLDGNPIWGSVIGGTSIEIRQSICTDNQYLYITGQFLDSYLTLYHYNEASNIVLMNPTINGTYNSFIAKYDLDGNPIWGSVVGSTLRSDGIYGVCADKTNLYVTGYFRDISLNLYHSNPASTIVLHNNNTTVNFMNMFIAKYDVDGNPVWGSVIGSNNSNNNSISNSICIHNNYLYVTGLFADASLTLYHYNEPSSIVLNKHATQSSTHNTFLAQYDLNGNPVWGSVIGGANYTGGNCICCDDNYVYITGFSTDASLTLYHYNEPSIVVKIKSPGQNTFIAKYNVNGKPVWGNSIEVACSGSSICKDNNYLYITGAFFNASLTLYHYIDSSSIVLNNYGVDVPNTFIAKYDLRGNPVWGRVVQGTVGNEGNSICVTTNKYIQPPAPEVCAPKCNTVYNLQQSGISRRQLMSQMLRSNSTISYDNTRTASYYITMLSLDYDKNKNLLLILKYTLYMRHFNKLVSCGKYNSNEMYSMIEDILANLTQEEYDIVYNIQKVIEVVTGPVVITITKTFYVVVDLNKTFFMIKNYNGEYFIPNLTYEFNLEDPSNLGSTFCISSYQNNIPVGGLTYNGTPGTPGATLLFKVPSNVQYQLYIFNSTLNSYSWGYSIPFIPIVANNVNSNISYTTLNVSSNAILSIYEKNGPKYFITNNDSSFLTSVNYKYSFYYGTYYLQVPKLYSVALLNNLCKNQIQYTGDIQKCVTSLVQSTTSDGTYNFYYDTIQISVYEPFTPVSLYSYYYGYLGAVNTIIFGYGSSKPYTRTDHPLINGIEKVYSQTKVLINEHGNITLNNNSTLSTSSQYGVYNGTYLFFTQDYITFLTNEINPSTNQINNKTNLFVVSGTNGIIGPGPDGITNYSFYSGVIQVKILGNFNQMSMYTYNNGYAGGHYILTYGPQFDNFIPHSYDFTTDTNLVLTENPIQYPTNKISLNKSYVSYNTITTDVSGRILFNNIPYDNTGNTVYTMTKGTYIFYALGPFIAFMTNNKSVTYRGNATGFYYTLGYAPNKEQYTFYTSIDTNTSHAIIVNVTGNFGYLSICTPSGYNGGQNLISFV
jgi:hypothetical protein